MGIEAIADYQKLRFKGNSANEGKWISSGLWSVLQHPNYLGEIMMWLGLYISSRNSYTKTWEHIVGALSPAFITYLLTQKSGIPILQKQARKRWGNNPAW